MITLLTLPLLCAAAQSPEESAFLKVSDFRTPEGEVLEIGGMDFSADGTLYLSTRRGRVWKVVNALADDPGEAVFSIFAEGLHEGLGLKVVDEVVHVVQRGEVSRLLDRDGDGVCERIETITQDWGMTGNYHEFAFGLPQDPAGNLYISTNVGFWSPEWWHGLSRAPYRGWVLRVAPDGTTIPVASGVRSPCGLGVDAAGNVFYSDNQGDWMPVCGIFPVTDGAFLGHPASLRWTSDYGDGAEIPSSVSPPEREPTPAAVWIPYEWSRSAGNLEVAPDGFGPFGGQWFVAELTNGNVVRMTLEQVNGVWQGACYPFLSRVGSAARLDFAPDGSLMLGYTNRGWGGRSPGSGLARVEWTDPEVAEIEEVELIPGGFRIRLTKAMAPEATPEVSLRSYDYAWWWDYGSPERNSTELEVLTSTLGGDRRTLTLVVPELQAGTCVRGRVGGAGLLHEEFAYTVNVLADPGALPVPVAKRVEPPAAREQGDEGWLMLTWQDPFDAWESEGWALNDLAWNADQPREFQAAPGNGALWNPGGRAGDFRSKAEFGDVEFHFRFQLPEGGDSGLYMMDRYELQLIDKPDECGGIIGSKNPRARGYRGPGEWHELSGRFYAPRFDSSGKKIQKARFEAIQIDGVEVLAAAECNGPTGGGRAGEVARGPLRFQGNAGLVALGDIRVKPLDGGAFPDDEEEGWEPAFGEHLPEGEIEEVLISPFEALEDFEFRGEIAIGEGGAAVLRLRTQEMNIGPVGHAVRIDSTGPGDERTGSHLGSPVRTQFIPAGTWFDLRVRCTRKTRVEVWLNGVLVSEEESPVRPLKGGLVMKPLIPDSGLRIRSAEIRRL